MRKLKNADQDSITEKQKRPSTIVKATAVDEESTEATKETDERTFNKT